MCEKYIEYVTGLRSLLTIHYNLRHTVLFHLCTRDNSNSRYIPSTKVPNTTEAQYYILARVDSLSANVSPTARTFQGARYTPMYHHSLPDATIHVCKSPSHNKYMSLFDNHVFLTILALISLLVYSQIVNYTLFVI